MPLSPVSLDVVTPIQALLQTDNFTITVPSSNQIVSLAFRNRTANAVTGGLRVGTTDGGVDVVVAQALGGNALVVVKDAVLLLRIFSFSDDTPLFVQAVTSWNSASVDCTILLAPAY